MRAFLMWLLELPSPPVRETPRPGYYFEMFGRLQANRKSR